MPASTPAALPPPLTRLHCELSWRKSFTSGCAMRGGEGVRGRPPWRCERREWEESESASSCASSFLLSSFPPFLILPLSPILPSHASFQTPAGLGNATVARGPRSAEGATHLLLRLRWESARRPVPRAASPPTRPAQVRLLSGRPKWTFPMFMLRLNKF